MVGDMLLRKVTMLNCLNNDNWGPVHIAARRGSIDCLKWIIKQNEILRGEGRETFDLNLMVIQIK